MRWLSPCRCRPPRPSGMRASPSCDSLRWCSLLQVGKTLALLAGGIEICRRQPRLIGRLDRRPLAIGHRKPRGVAVASLDDHVLAKRALVGEAEPQRGAFRRSVEIV